MTVLRDCVDGADLQGAEAINEHISGWTVDYSNRAPHSMFGIRRPADYRAATMLSSPMLSRTFGSTPRRRTGGRVAET
jgi:hypothetical protein